MWMTSVLVGPIFLLLNPATRDLVDYMSSGAYMWFFLAAVIIGVFVSSPFFLLFWFCYELVAKWKLNTLLIKISLIMIILLCCLSILAILSSPDSTATYDTLQLLGAYAVPLMFGVTVYKLDKPIKMSEVVQKKAVNEE